MTTFLDHLETWILALASSVWVYPAMYAFATIDGFFPPIPSESVVITLAVSAATTGAPNLAVVLLVASLGAWTGDQIAYSIGRAIGTERVPFLRGERGRKAVGWAERALANRGASFILAARYVPIGRVAVNMTAGAVGYPRRRFMAFSGIAAVTWALYSVVIGLVAARWLGHEPLLAMAVGVVFGVVLGVVIDQIIMARTRRRVAQPSPAALSPAPGVVRRSRRTTGDAAAVDGSEPQASRRTSEQPVSEGLDPAGPTTDGTEPDGVPADPEQGGGPETSTGRDQRAGSATVVPRAESAGSVARRASARADGGS
ncbi:DedA family protein [Oerskovia flava]|uniref:DedA family protein n=1 Tax=Oerskovia flava TaxID=2986422 RepID=UPI00223FB113|nr:DedA family protein [Oerskovia sp. JB1-3-2]